MVRTWPPVLGGRLGAQRTVLAAAALTTLLAATVAGALGLLGSQVLGEAAQHRLDTAPGTVVALSGTVTAGSAGPATRRVRAALRAGLGPVPFALNTATWSDELPLPVPGAGSARSPGQPDGTLEVQAAAMAGVTRHAVLLAGHWPGRPAGGVIPAALPATAAASLRLVPGALLRLRDVLSHRRLLLQITGLYRPRDPGSAYWRLSLLGPDGRSAVSQFVIYGPLLVDPAAFRLGLTSTAESWSAAPVLGRIPEAAYGATAARLSAQLQALADPAGPLGGLQLSTSLPAVLRGTADSLVVARSLLAMVGLQVLLLAGTALAASARLLAGQRAAELSLLTARGGGRWQLAGITAAEAVPLALAAALAGALASGPLAAVLAGGGSLRAAGLRVSGGGSAAWLAAAVVAVLTALVMLFPVLTSTPPGQARAARGRQAAMSRAVRSGADVALILLAVLAAWQLRRYAAVAPSPSGALTVDPVLVAAPALTLAGGTVAGMRLLPAAARAGDRLAARGRRISLPLALWRVSRRPLRQAGPALLVVLGVATGTLALAQHHSWLRSSSDQAAFSAGAPVRVDLPGPVPLGQAARLAAGHQAAMPVARSTAGNGAVLLALDAPAAASTVLLRRDLAAGPPGSLFARLTRPARPGLVLPGRPARAELTLTLGPAALGMRPGTVTVAVQDADGDTYLVPAGPLPADGRPHRLAVVLSREAIRPLRLLQITVAYPLPPRAGGTAVLSVGRPRGPAAPGGTAEVPGTVLDRWTATATSPQYQQLTETFGLGTPAAPPDAVSWSAAGRGIQALSFAPGYGIDTAVSGGPGPVRTSGITGLVTLSAPGLGGPAIPGVASRAFLAAGDLTVGSTVQASVGGAAVPVRITGTVAAFPTVTGPAGALVVDLGSLQDELVSRGAPPAGVTQWWRAAARPPPGVPSGSVVVTRDRLLAGLRSDPVPATPQQVLLAVAVTAAVLALAGFAVSLAASLRERSLESAVLAALGVGRGTLARQLCLEQLLLSVPAALAGMVLGAVSALLLVPAVTLTPLATLPVPGVLTTIPWGQVALLALVVAVTPVLVAAVLVARRPDPAAALRAAESG